MHETRAIVDVFEDRTLSWLRHGKTERSWQKSRPRKAGKIETYVTYRSNTRPVCLNEKESVFGLIEWFLRGQELLEFVLDHSFGSDLIPIVPEKQLQLMQAMIKF